MVLKIGSILLSLLFIIACSSPSSIDNNTVKEETNSIVNSKALYTLHCEACHGMDGTKGISGAANLKVSKLTDFQIKHTIENGNDKGMMPFKDLINSETEIDSLVSFVKSLRN